jgi:FMN phosphatase YigB (HAD superfamily)
MHEFVKAATLIRNAQIVILDVDDNLYSRDLPLHADIKARICRNANETNILGIEVQAADLGHAFPIIVKKVLDTAGEDGLRSYFEDVYGVDYSCLSRDPALAEGIAELKRQSKRIIAYTNGPASRDPGRPLHFETVIRCLGLPDETFAPTDIYDLTRMIRTGYGKPTAESALHMLEVCEIPAEAEAVFIDDNIANLAAFKGPRVAARNPVSTIWSQAPDRGGGMAVRVLEHERCIVDAICGSVGQILAEAAGLAPIASGTVATSSGG